MGSYYLFASPGFWGGMARVLDLGTTLKEFNYSLHPTRADFLAIRSDWAAIGGDLSVALNRYQKAPENGNTQKEKNQDGNS